MTSNFRLNQQNPETNISFGEGESSYYDDRLKHRQHQISYGIEYQLPPPVNSIMNDDVAMIPSSKSSIFANSNSRMQDIAIPPCIFNDSSPNCVMSLKKVMKPIETKAQSGLSEQNLTYGDTWSAIPNVEQYHNAHHHQQQQQLNFRQQYQHGFQQFPNQHQYQNRQRLVEPDCLYPGNDQRATVRFRQSLSVYDNFEDHDYSFITTDEKTAAKIQQERDDCKLFLLHRALHCWYSREELKLIKNERKQIVRALKKVKYDIGLIDTSIHELRGLEAYFSPRITMATQRKRKETLESVLGEQQRQRQSAGGICNVERLKLVSLKASEWFRNRALEIAQKDAKEARDLCLNHPEVMRMMNFLDANGKSTAQTTEQNSYELFNESFGLMDIDGDDEMNGIVNESTLNFWANSSWTRELMDE